MTSDLEMNRLYEMYGPNYKQVVHFLETLRQTPLETLESLVSFDAYTRQREFVIESDWWTPSLVEGVYKHAYIEAVNIVARDDGSDAFRYMIGFNAGLIALRYEFPARFFEEALSYVPAFSNPEFFRQLSYNNNPTIPWDSEDIHVYGLWS